MAPLWQSVLIQDIKTINSALSPLIKEDESYESLLDKFNISIFYVRIIKPIASEVVKFLNNLYPTFMKKI